MRVSELIRVLQACYEEVGDVVVLAGEEQDIISADTYQETKHAPFLICLSLSGPPVVED